MKVPQSMPFVGMEEYEAIKQCFETNWITEGPLAKEFSEKLCAMTGAKYGVLTPNGTLGLTLALKAIGIKPGDEVIVPDSTFLASATSVEFLGAKPVFVDICDDLQINVDDCERVLSDKTRAIMPVHLFGFTPDMGKVDQFAKKHSLLVIEDAAQGLGIKWNGKSCGNFGDVASFSFFADKTLTTCEGGFVTTNSEEIYENLLFLRNQGRRNRGTFVHSRIGYNFRMTDIQCAIGLTQLKKFNTIMERKNYIYERYTEAFSDFEHVEVYQPSKEINPFIPFRVTLRTKNNEANQLMEHMRKNEVEPRMFFYPLHLQPAFADWLDDPRYDKKHFPVAERSYDNGVCLPSFVAITDEQIEYTCKVIRSYYN